ncbi:hypothetical protein HYX09_01450 [Candidatus Woesearchaeota archaeon]|nr:hypothetical protein [Candidatus Woesearchaeota archaeon]MBI2660912.1 hypothetical protein [Candidatus Woesearchaeota archaeon]
MKKTLVIMLLALSVLAIACGEKTTTGAYAGYQGQGPAPQPQYVGGGCGVAPAEENVNVPNIETLAA